MISPVCCMCLVLALISVSGMQTVIVCGKLSVYIFASVMIVAGHPSGLCFYS